ncbi:MAG TPA: DUF503 domain-containing protein [Candidatus Deferrimicrobium sp.]|nr:DUF503 domain-containing protein [Candidatus Deferrimicrobium sp.]
MVTVTVRCRLHLAGVSSLKEKRRILKSLMTRLRNDFNISIAEVDDNDVLRRATLGAAAVANNSRFADEMIAKVVDRLKSDPNIMLADYVTESY